MSCCRYSTISISSAGHPRRGLVPGRTPGWRSTISLSSLNRARIVKTPRAVRAVLAVAKENGEVGKVAMMVLCVLASDHDGSMLMMDVGAVAALAEILKKEVEEEEERCVAVIYGMSRGAGGGSGGLARTAGTEEVVARVAEKGCGGEEVREMPKKAVRAMSGEVGDGDGASSMETSMASDGFFIK